MLYSIILCVLCRYTIRCKYGLCGRESGVYSGINLRLFFGLDVNGKYNAVYSYASYTSCLAQGAKVATVFSLMVGLVTFFPV